MENDSDIQSDTNVEEASKSSNATPTFASFIWDLAKVLLLAFIIIIPIRYFLFQPFIVSGSSMEPNFSNGDYLIIDEISYRLGDPERGDVVVTRFPGDLSQFFIKRVIGLPGEKVEITDGVVKIYKTDDSKAMILDEEYLSRNTLTSGELSITLNDKQYFVLGDNRSASSDSRAWGPLARSNIIGRAWVRIFPFSNSKFIPNPQYTSP